jgi:hypothetical protein
MKNGSAESENSYKGSGVPGYSPHSPLQGVMLCGGSSTVWDMRLKCLSARRAVDLRHGGRSCRFTRSRRRAGRVQLTWHSGRYGPFVLPNLLTAIALGPECAPCRRHGMNDWRQTAQPIVISSSSDGFVVDARHHHDHVGVLFCDQTIASVPARCW